MNRVSPLIRQLLLPTLLLAGVCAWVGLQPAPRANPAEIEPGPAIESGFQPLADLAGNCGIATQVIGITRSAKTLDWQPIPRTPEPPPSNWESTVSVLEPGNDSANPAAELPNSPAADNRQPLPNPAIHQFISSNNRRSGSAADSSPATAIQDGPASFELDKMGAVGSEPVPSPVDTVVRTDFSVLGNDASDLRRESTIPAFSPPNAQSVPLLNESAPNGVTSLVPPKTASNKANPANSYLLESLKPPRTNEGQEVPPTLEDFSAPPTNYDSFNPSADMQIYQGKRLYATQRPLLELGRPWYQLGQLPQPQSWLGFHNPVSQQFLVFGDVRSAIAANQLGGDSQSLFAYQANLFFDWRFTGTERIHFNINPFTQGANSTRYLFDDDDFISEFNADLNFGFFEGDLGAIMGGLTNTTLPFDLPLALGVMPLVIQNGIWLDDAFLGAAVTLPARNSPLLDISNYDVTFFAGWDKLNSPAFGADDNAAKVYGTASWIEALSGYIEADYAFVEDRDSSRDLSYHNIGLGYTRRFGHLLSNSTRVIVNAGQSTTGGPNTADGLLLLSENSLITANPSTILPYFNLFAGFDRPQSVGRAGIAGGILRNTGILFETDNMTGYPTLDATANQTYGMALGLSLMPQNFSQQLVLEGAMLGVMGDDLGRNAAAAQRGVGFRYQLPLNNSIIFRVDGMYGFLAETDDISGLRVELRRKF